MPRSTKRKATRKPVRFSKAPKQETQSYVSLLYGVFSVFILFLLFIFGLQFFTPKHNTSKGVITKESASTSKVEEKRVEVTRQPTEVVVNKTVQEKVAQVKTVQKNSVQEKDTYTVKEGDYLWKIADTVYHDGFKWVEIARVNNLENPGVITQGTVLKLPKLANAQTAAENAPPTQVSSGDKIVAKTYVIQKGDDLWDVAVRAYGDGYKWVEIARANNLTDPNTIHSGNTLVLPRS